MSPLRALWRRVTGRLDRSGEFYPAGLAVARADNGTVILTFDLERDGVKAAVVLPRAEAVRLADALIDGLLEKEDA